MGKKNLDDSFVADEMLFGDDFDVEAFEQEHFEKNARRASRRKMKRRAALRRRFTDMEETRWLKRRARDWEQYGTSYDTDEDDYRFYAVD